MNYNPDDEEEDYRRDDEEERVSSGEDLSSSDYSSEDSRNAQNCASWAFTERSAQEKSNAARNLGPNWANIMSGLGDQ